MSEESPRILLASASPRRREVLERLGLDFEVRPAPAGIEGDPEPGESPVAFAVRTAGAKAAHVAGEVPDAVLLAADTIVVIDGEVLGKPAGPAEAADMVRRLSGRRHVVHTGVAVRGPRERNASGVESTRVRFRVLSDADVDAYVATGEPLDKAGAYGIQGYGAALVDRIEGCYFNVMGLPVTRVLALLEEAGWRYRFPGRLVESRRPR